ncbi:protein kinase domain-containing protein [Intrasporangium sp.]|uniref:serine/threonine protein kinase n=1 Tax=Intrasporangium sp. TaxID=1925024 RepID=UPI00293AD7F3|nr:hypothetical protein [Intrasporangium sp.]MDV3222290.1 hypothetical protein [Intrasporangium sp.]
MEDHLTPGGFITARASEEGDSWVAVFSTEPLAGLALTQVVEEHGGLTDGQVTAVAGLVATALAAAHGGGVVHGALSPEHVTLSPEDAVVQIGGFGGRPIAGWSASPYLAPEQVAGGELEPRSDLFALGCLMMTMLTGEPPVPAPGSEAPSESASAPGTGAPWPSDRRPDIDPALNGLVHDLLAHSPTRRPVSAAEVVSRLGRIAADLADRHVVATLPGAVAPAGTGAVATATVDGDPPDDTELLAPILPVAGAALPHAPAGEVPRGLPDPATHSTQTQVISALEPEDDDSDRVGVAGVLGVDSIPWPWVAGSLAAVALVLLTLFTWLGGDDTKSPVAAPATTAPPTSTPSSPTEGGSPSSAVTPGTPTTSRPSVTTTTASASATTSATVRSPAPTTAVPDDSPQPQTLGGAVSSLRATVRDVVASGEVDRASGDDLVQRADELSRWVDRSPVQLSRRVSALDSYVERLASSGDITSGGYRQVSGAIAAVQAQLA